MSIRTAVLTWRTHLVGGLASLYLIQPLAPPSAMGMLAMAAAFGALLPDLDAHESHLKHLSLGGIKPFVLPSIALHRLLGHRGPLHSLLGLAVSGLVLSLPFVLLFGEEAPFTIIALLLGMASHLMLDAMTPFGIPLFYPSPKRVHLLPRRLWIVTGTAPEDVVLAMLAMAAVALFLQNLPIAP